MGLRDAAKRIRRIRQLALGSPGLAKGSRAFRRLRGELGLAALLVDPAE
jgi:hypothetical protein